MIRLRCTKLLNEGTLLVWKLSYLLEDSNAVEVFEYSVKPPEFMFGGMDVCGVQTRIVQKIYDDRFSVTYVKSDANGVISMDSEQKSYESLGKCKFTQFEFFPRVYGMLYGDWQEKQVHFDIQKFITDAFLISVQAGTYNPEPICIDLYYTDSETDSWNYIQIGELEYAEDEDWESCYQLWTLEALGEWMSSFLRLPNLDITKYVITPQSSLEDF